MEGMEAEYPDKFPTLKDMKSLPVQVLRAIYEAVMHTPPPQRISPDFLRGNIAWTLQAHGQNKPPLALRQALTTRITGTMTRGNRLIKSGTRLIREWQGQTYEVAVLEAGYLWQGVQYRSLSRIAKKITGTRWSGPRFFGLKDTSNG